MVGGHVRDRKFALKWRFTLKGEGREDSIQGGEVSVGKSAQGSNFCVEEELGER